jgi:protein TonB
VRRVPDYPEIAVHNGWEGTVRLKAYVREDGTVGEVRLTRSSGRRELDEAAVDALRQWQFAPAREGDRPVGDWRQVPFHFNLE